MATNPGIDYGMGKVNIDHETGIRYGVVNQGEVLQAWADSSEAEYDNDHCPECGHDLRTRKNGNLFCPGCKEFDPETSFDMQEAEAFTYDKDGYICTQSADDPDIFIIKSPYFTYAQFCSPCAPGAGYLMSPFTMSKEMPIDDSLPLGGYAAHAIASGFPKVYCFDHSFFDNGKAPYPVFSVETGELVNP